MRVIKVEEFHALLKDQGVKREHLAFVCPMCGTVQSFADFYAVGVDKDEADRVVGFSCIGRWKERKPPPKKKGTQDGCDWTLGGLFRCHELEVETPDGERHPHFVPASREQAQEHMNRKEQNDREGAD